MAQYKIFDNIVQSNKASSYVTAAIELLKELKIDATVLGGPKVDIATEGKALDKEIFAYNCAYNLASAKKSDADIICVEDSSYTSLNIAKIMLLEDSDLKEIIAEKLKKNGLELCLETKVFSISEILRDVVGFDKLATMIKKPFSNFNVAIFKGNKLLNSDINDSIMTLLGANLVSFDTQNDSDGYEVYDASKTIADKLAGKIMLDAFDNAADFVVANDSRSFFMFDSRQKHLECSVGRDIELCVYSTAQVVLMALGCDDKAKIGLDSHKVVTTLI